jgi:hypothetical protein
VSQETQGVRFKFGTGIAGYVADKGVPVNCKNVYLDPRFDSTFDEKVAHSIHPRSLLCIIVMIMLNRLAIERSQCYVCR